MAMAVGFLTGVLYVVGAVIFDDYRGGIIPFWLGTAISIAVLVAVALATVGTAVVVYLVLTRLLHGRAVIVTVCAATAALVGGGGGLLISSTAAGVANAMIWAVMPAAYVAVIFPRLHGYKH